MQVPLYMSYTLTFPRRSGLPSEALEEFLSILKPSSFLPSISPRRRQVASLPNLNHEQPFTIRAVPRLELMTDSEDNELVRSVSPGRMVDTLDARNADGDDNGNGPFRWFSSHVLCTYPMLSFFLPS